MTLLPLFISLCQLASTGALAVDDSPAKPEEWGFRPAQESKVATTPPAFVWRPVKGKPITTRWKLPATTILRRV